MKPRTFLALFALIGICDAAVISESQTEELSDPIVAENVDQSDGTLTPEPPAPFYNPTILEFLNLLTPSRNGSGSVQIDDRIIPNDETVDLANALIAYQPELSAISDCIKVNEIIVSAIKTRSLVPDCVINVDSIRESKSDRLNGKRLFELASARQLLVNTINFAAEPLIDYWPKYEAALEEVVNFDFNGEKSIDELVAEKDAQNVQKTAESFEIISKIQQILQLKSPISSEKFSTTLLNSISLNLIFMSGLLDSMQKYQIVAQEGTQSKKVKALRKWLKRYNDLNEHLQEVINSLQES